MPMPKFCPACGSGERVLPILDRAGYDLLPPTDPVIFVPRSGQVRCTNPECGARFTVTFYKRDGNDALPKAEAASARNGNESVGATAPAEAPPSMGPDSREPRVLGGAGEQRAQAGEGVVSRDGAGPSVADVHHPRGTAGADSSLSEPNHFHRETSHLLPSLPPPRLRNTERSRTMMESRVVGGTAGELVQVHEGHILLRDDEARALIARLEHRIDLLERTVTR